MWVLLAGAVGVGILVIVVGVLNQPQTLKDETTLVAAHDQVQLSVRVVEPVEEPRAILILAHSLGGSKADWAEFIQEALAQGYAAVAYDARGNGDSQGNLKAFTEEDFQLFPSDLNTILNFTAHIFSGSNTPMILIGSSIGANTVLHVMQNAKTSGDMKAMVLLSPGTEYRGLSIENIPLPQDIPALLIASKEDEYAFASSEQLASRFPEGQVEFVRLEKAGHGTAMLTQSPFLTQRIFNWLNALDL